MLRLARACIRHRPCMIQQRPGCVIQHRVFSVTAPLNDKKEDKKDESQSKTDEELHKELIEEKFIRQKEIVEKYWKGESKGTALDAFRKVWTEEKDVVNKLWKEGEDRERKERESKNADVKKEGQESRANDEESDNENGFKMKLKIGPFSITVDEDESEDKTKKAKKGKEDYSTKEGKEPGDDAKEEVKDGKKEETTKKDEKDPMEQAQKDAMEMSTEMMSRMMGINPLKYDIVMPGSKDSMSFKDVGGHYEAKVELMEVVDFLKNPEKYQILGAKVPSGALLTGPPGNGKTLLAKAIAGESDVPFISTAGPQFIEKIGGLGAKRVRDLFVKAKEMAPCILFIDELDAIGSRNDLGFEMDGAGGGTDEADQVINQFLVELDGMATRSGEVFVIGATNREEKIDKALKRAGRLERKIYIDLPTLSEREEIFKLNLLKIKSNFDLDTQATRLALLTPRYSGADVANIVNEAAIEAARNAQSAVESTNFESAIERVIAGMERRSHNVSKDETKISAYYEASQALLGWVLPKGDKVLKMSIKPRLQNTMGFTQLEPQLDYLHSKERLLDMVCQGLAGRAGEALFFNHITNRAHSDLKNANDVCHKMVTIYGMGESAANLSFPPGPNPGIRPYSNSLQRRMDAEIHEMLSEAYRKSSEIVTQYRTEVEYLAELLIEKETLNEDDIAVILKDVPSTRPHKFSKTQGR